MALKAKAALALAAALELEIASELSGPSKSGWRSYKVNETEAMIVRADEECKGRYKVFIYRSDYPKFMLSVTGNNVTHVAYFDRLDDCKRYVNYVDDQNWRFYKGLWEPGQAQRMFSRDLPNFETGVILFADSIEQGLGMPYNPASDAGMPLQTDVPDSMGFETHEALKVVEDAVGGDVDNFVRDRLGYTSLEELSTCLSAEQIDAVAMAIYNIEGRRQGMIVGDQTGIGKGRVAAAMIRYGWKQGKTPIFLTLQPNLFSDIYRDLKAIGCPHLKPFIINSNESKTKVKDEEGKVIYEPLPDEELKKVLATGSMPDGYDYIMATYSQFTQPEKKPQKPNFLSDVATGAMLIMDEAHRAAGESASGLFLQGVVAKTDGVLFLSATFAKTPKNMPLYALKTAISEAAMSREEMVEAITKGGVALQEIISAQLVSEGQMLRRERSYEGIEVNYLTLDEKAAEHKAALDVISSIIRRIIEFQKEYVAPMVKGMDKAMAKEQASAGISTGSKDMGVSSTPYFSKVFNVINQILFAIKAESVAEHTISRLREGKAPVIAFSSTMGSFLDGLFESETESEDVPEGDIAVSADFATVLLKGLEGVMRMTIKKGWGSSETKTIHYSDLSDDGQHEYKAIEAVIRRTVSGVCISPIDVIKRRIQEAGYTVAEVTGRKLELRFTEAPTNIVREFDTNLNLGKTITGATTASGKLFGIATRRKRENVNDAFRRFNNNEVDVLMINQSGATGASAHAIVTAKVDAGKVRQRVMIVAQAELDINNEVQKRGRINRTGQIRKPIYDYLTSAIPAESRLMMMLQKKLKSLDANTASNQKNSKGVLDVADFLNKYGDRVVSQFLIDNPTLDAMLGSPLGGDIDVNPPVEDAAQKVSGRVAVLPTDKQAWFYSEITERYNNLVDFLKQTGEYDLEVEELKLDAETINTKTVIVGKGGASPFGQDSVLETCEVNVLRKPYTPDEIGNLLLDSLSGYESAYEAQKDLLHEFLSAEETRLSNELTEMENRFQPKIKAASEQHEYEKTQALVAEMDEAAGKIRYRSNNRKQSLEEFFTFFRIGKAINYVDGQGEDADRIAGVFIGFLVDRSKSNPYAPSAIRARFALASGMKMIDIPLSMSVEIRSIMAASISTYFDALTSPADIGTHRAWWERMIEDVASAARTKRFIVTGNVLQAMPGYRGKLVSYTLKDGGIAKGILMPEKWEQELKRDGSGHVVRVPLRIAGRLISMLSVGDVMACSNGVKFQGSPFSPYGPKRGVKMYVPASRAVSGHIYLDEELNTMLDDGMWNKKADKMMATIREGELLDDVLARLEKIADGTFEVSETQAASLIRVGTRKVARRTVHIAVPLPAPDGAYRWQHKNKEVDKIGDIQLRARAALALAAALELEIELDLF